MNDGSPRIPHDAFVFVGAAAKRCSCTMLATRELGTDAPGRALNSLGTPRSAMEQTDWHTQEEERFLRTLASRLDAAVNAGQTKSLILVAPPRALGVLRQTYSHTLRAALRAEIDKDFVKLPVHEIEKHLAA
jgi:protein required for attachment to host cells